MSEEREGALLVNLGTPRSTAVADVRRYLGEFLNDPRVIDVPTLARRALVHGVILRTRPPRSAEAYRKIWTERGSPLLFHGQDLRDRVQAILGERFVTELAMRYGEPSIARAFDRFAEAGVRRVRVLLLFPQYSSAAWGSAAEAVAREASGRLEIPALDFLPPFYDHPDYLDVQASRAKDVLADFDPEHVLLSFHGVPERQIRRSPSCAQHCLAAADCCTTPHRAHAYCYRAHCFATARGLRERLGLDERRSEVVFQSRLGRTPWIRPFFDERVRELARAGTKRVLVLSPSFVADCLETLEEIGMRAVEDFRAEGGEELRLVPSLNAGEDWARVVAGWIRAR